MTKNPLINALTATLYIILIAFIMFYSMDHTRANNTVIVPIVVLSLFTLSAAVMGYIFLSQPLLLYLDGKKKQAINLFLQTLASFAGITVLGLIALLSGIIR